MTAFSCPRISGPVHLRVRVPGSKSITNRALAIAAWADGTSLLRNALFAEDTMTMVEALRNLGIRITLDESMNTMEVTGCRGQPPAGEADIFCKDAGTVLRFLTAMSAATRGAFRFNSGRRLRERPISALTAALQSLGAGFEFPEREGCLPFVLRADGLRGGDVRLTDPESSQFLSALLLAAPYASSDVFLEIGGLLPSQPYVDMTLALMDQFSVVVVPATSDTRGPRRWVVPALQRYQARTLRIEPDATSASYFLAAPALAGGSAVVRGLGRRSVQGDVRFADVLQRMGCRVTQTEEDLTVARDPGEPLRGIDVDLNAMPDAVPTLAAVALGAQGVTTIRNVANLRFKESDRLTALAGELHKLGAAVDVLADGLCIHPPQRLTSAKLDPHNDHRLAMSFAVVGLICPGIAIRDAECCRKTYPNFFSDWSTHIAASGGTVSD